jgi:DNA processing protein
VLLRSDFVPRAEIEKYSRLALAAIRQAGIQHFGIRVHGTPEYPPRLRDADHPIGLLYFQGNWESVNTPCVAVIGTREPSLQGKLRAAKFARLLAADGFTVVSGLAHGIGTVAHTMTIEAGGSTIAVLFFPACNATMSALTEATIIVEAGEISGALVHTHSRCSANLGHKVAVEHGFAATTNTIPSMHAVARCRLCSCSTSLHASPGSTSASLRRT